MPQAVPVAPPKKVYVSFSAEIVPFTTEALLKTFANLHNQGVAQVHLLLGTPGGNVACGINIYNVLLAMSCKIITHNVDSVNSIGNVVFLAGQERYANPGTTFMFHGVGFDVTADVRFEEKLLRERLDGIMADQTRIADIIWRRAKFSDRKEIEALFLQAATKDTQFAKDRGIIDDIREAKVPPGCPVIQLVFER